MSTITIDPNSVIPGSHPWVLWKFAAPGATTISSETHTNILALSQFIGEIQLAGLNSTDPIDNRLDYTQITKWLDTSDPAYQLGDTLTFFFPTEANADPSDNGATAIARAERFVLRANQKTPGSSEKLEGPNVRVRYIPSSVNPLDPTPVDPPPVVVTPPPKVQLPSNKATRLRSESLVKELADIVRVLQSSLSSKLSPAEALALETRIGEISQSLLSPTNGVYYNLIVVAQTPSS